MTDDKRPMGDCSLALAASCQRRKPEFDFDEIL